MVIIDHALVCRMGNTSSLLGAIIISSWKYGIRQDSRTCMSFNYRLLGYETTMKVLVETNSATKHVIWQEKNLEKNTSWRHGRIFVGFSSRYRVSRVSTSLPHACKPLLPFSHHPSLPSFMSILSKEFGSPLGVFFHEVSAQTK